MLAIGIVLGVILLLAFLSENDSRQTSNRDHFAHPSGEDDFVLLEFWSNTQTTNDLKSTNSDYSSGDSGSWSGDTGGGGIGDCGGGSWSGGDCGGGGGF